MNDMAKIGLIGDYHSDVVAHKTIPSALKLSAAKLRCLVEYEWLFTEMIKDKYFAELKSFNGLWAVPASPYKNIEGALSAIRFARENNIPFLGNRN